MDSDVSSRNFLPSQRVDDRIADERAAEQRVTDAPAELARHRIPTQRDGDRQQAATVVIPYAASAIARRTRLARAWMISLPVDLCAMLAPVVWERSNWRGMIFTAVLAVVLFAFGGLYRGRRHISFLDELPNLIGRLLAAAAVAALIAAVRHDSVDYIDSFLRTILVSAALVLVGRAMTRRIVLMARGRRWVEHGALVLGGGPVAAELARLLCRYPQYGLRFAGFVDDNVDDHQSQLLRPLVGRLDDLEKLIALTETDVLIVADIAGDETRLMEVVRGPAARNCDLWVVPRLRDFTAGSGIPDHVGAIPLVQLRRATLTGPKWALKRASDIVLASLGLVVVSPVMLVCAVAVLIEGGPGIFFRQERIGRYGRPFEVYKFRSMRPADPSEAKTTWSVAHDPRVGPVGRFLRRTSLDELPQLWNILRGDMTIVGPRPERPFFVEQFSAEHPTYSMRHRVPVGLTGLAQVSGLRGDTPISDRTRFDNYYIENWSLWLDVKVLLRTVGEVLRGGGR